MATSESGTADHEENSWAFQDMLDLTVDHPSVAISVILEICARERSRRVVFFLSAGPLEELLAAHGEEFIKQLETAAEKNPQLRKVLGGIWKDVMPDTVWNRVKTIWDRRGWDGIPDNYEKPNSDAQPSDAPRQ